MRSPRWTRREKSNVALVFVRGVGHEPSLSRCVILSPLSLPLQSHNVQFGGRRAKRDEEEDDFEASDGDSDEGIDEGACYYRLPVAGLIAGP